MTRYERMMWDARTDRARIPGPRMALLAVAGFCALGATEWLWSALEDARALIWRAGR